MWADIKVENITCRSCRKKVEEGIMTFPFLESKVHFYYCKICNKKLNDKLGKNEVMNFNSVEDFEKYMMVRRL